MFVANAARRKAILAELCGMNPAPREEWLITKLEREIPGEPAREGDVHPIIE
jgi:hypothetical protein